MRQAAVVHIGPPAQAAGFFPRHLPRLNLLRRRLVGAYGLELRGHRRVVEPGGDELLGHNQEHIQNLAGGRQDPGGGRQRHLAEHLWILSGHFRRQPATEGEAQHVQIGQAEVL